MSFDTSSLRAPALRVPVFLDSDQNTTRPPTAPIAQVAQVMAKKSVFEPVPTEVLQSIMAEHATSASYYRVRASGDQVMGPALMAAQRVSRHWRNVANSTPEYWQDIHLRPRYQLHAPRFAARAHHRDLKLSVIFDVQNIKPEAIKQLKATIISLAAHCTSIFLQTDRAFMDWLLSAPVICKFVGLQKLRLMPHGDGRRRISATQLQAVRQLSHLRVLDFQDISPGRLAISGLHLTCLRFQEWFGSDNVSLTQFVNMLESINTLESLCLQGTGWPWAEEFCFLTHIDMPALKSLELGSLCDEFPREEHVLYFLDSLRAPNLVLLRLTDLFDGVVMALCNHLPDMATHFPRLKSLFLAHPDMNLEDVTTFFQKFSHITELTLWHLQRLAKHKTSYSIADLDDGVLPKLELLQIMDVVSPEDIQSFRSARKESGLPLPSIECHAIASFHGHMTQWEADRRWPGLVRLRSNVQIVLGEHLEKMAPLRYYGWDWAYYDARWGLDMV